MTVAQRFKTFKQHSTHLQIVQTDLSFSLPFARLLRCKMAGNFLSHVVFYMDGSAQIAMPLCHPTENSAHSRKRMIRDFFFPASIPSGRLKSKLNARKLVLLFCSLEQVTSHNIPVCLLAEKNNCTWISFFFFFRNICYQSKCCVLVETVCRKVWEIIP